MTVAALPQYTMDVRRGTAMIDETVALLRAWQPAEPLGQFTSRVLRDDVLGKATARRAQDVVKQVFAPRFLRPNAQAARHLRAFLLTGGRDSILDLAWLYACRADRLLRDTTVSIYWPAARSGRLLLSADDVMPYLREAEADGRIAVPWSPTITYNVARGIIAVWGGFGLLEGRARRGGRRIAPYRLSDRIVIYVAYLLHAEGSTDAEVIAHEDWAIFGADSDEVTRRLLRLGNEGWWEAQSGAGIVRITWRYAAIDDVVQALTAGSSQ